MKRCILTILSLLLLFSCASTEMVPVRKAEETIEKVYVSDLDEIRTTISVDGRLCTLTISAVTGEKSIIVDDERGYVAYALSELTLDKDGKRYLYSTSGNINIILSGHVIYISIGTDWTETHVERDYLSPFIFATHA